MLTLLAATVLSQQASDVPLRLLPGDQWTANYSYHFESDDIDMINVESTTYSVAKVNGKSVLTAQWKLVETKVDGETAPVPKGVKPIVIKLGLDGESQTEWINEDVQRYRIERVLQVERKGLSEPSFFRPPPTVRFVGIDKKVWLDPASKVMFRLSAKEQGGDFPIQVIGHYTLNPDAGFLDSGLWTISNCPIPGGSALCELTVKLKVQDVKLAPRK